MFRSLQNDVGAPQNAFSFDNKENGGDDVYVEVESNELNLHFNPSLLTIPKGFKEDEKEMLRIVIYLL